MSDLREIRLPANLCAAAERKFKNRFGSVEDLLRFLLREITEDQAASLDEAEQQMLEARLKDLGYL
jgi:hypothetical protein